MRRPDIHVGARYSVAPEYFAVSLPDQGRLRQFAATTATISGQFSVPSASACAGSGEAPPCGFLVLVAGATGRTTRPRRDVGDMMHPSNAAIGVEPLRALFP